HPTGQWQSQELNPSLLNLLKDTTSVKPELVLQHCFKQYKLRDLYPKFFFKVKPTAACEVHPEVETWITERRKLRSQLDSLVDVEKWLSQKLCTTEQEDRVLENLQDCRAVRKNLLSKHDLPPQTGVIPLINAPYPQSLITLHNLLHKQKLKMVDLFKKADKDKKRFMRSDFIKVIKGVYNVFVSCDSTACPRFHTRKVVSKTVSRPASAAGKTKERQPLAPSEPGAKLTLLEVPPIDTEPDHRPLSYEEMEEIGKRCKERRRWEKMKINPIQWMERCRLVRSGNKAIDEHCLPSTMESEMGEIIDQHRRTCYMVYLQCLKLCKDYNIPLTEKVLEKALLYPGDKIIKVGASVRKIRQPGGPYTTMDGSHHQRRLLLNRQGLRDGLKRDTKNGERHCKNMLFFRRLHMKWSNLSCKSHDNNFWPGHLLDKLRIYLPQIEPNREHALFSYVSPTPPVYPGVYNPHRSWPISDQGYVTYGNIETEKY
uniref:EF-hand calcium binding domain 12 n=1 Tax=Chelydra serpentina TaxID=8475 RepID=A0A8C3RS26_CHESE